MLTKSFALRSVVCAFGVFAWLALPSANAATGKQRVHVQYPAKSAAKYTVKRVAKTPAHKYAAHHESFELTADGLPSLKSAAALVVDFNDGQQIYGKNTQGVTPIASITKLMTSMVVLDANLPLDETIYVDTADLDYVKHTYSRLAVGTALPRRDMLRLALMSSENRAAASLGRSYPGGSAAFTAAMNRKAAELGMSNTHFVDSTGLSSETTTTAHEVETAAGRSLQFRNSNGLVKSPEWEIGLSKTGYISEAGRCLVMQAKIGARHVVIVLLDSWGKYTRLADAKRIKKWLESHSAREPGIG